MSDVFLCLWNFLNYDFTYHGLTFSLFNVIEAGVVLSIIGMAIAKIFFFALNKR